MSKKKKLFSSLASIGNNEGKEKKTPFYRSRPVLIGGAIVVILVALVPSLYFYDQYQTLRSGSSSKDQVAQLTLKVGSLIELPAGENPTIATVSDVTKLTSQPFFAHAQNGDKVFIYQKAKEAILYRPSMNKLIQVGSLNLAAAVPTPSNQPHQQVAGAAISPTVTPTPAPVKVEVYNGPKTPGRASTSEKKILIPNITFVGTGNATNDYDKTIVVDLSGKHAVLASQIAKTVNGTISPLPTGEKAPTADVLIVLGKDYK